MSHVARSPRSPSPEPSATATDPMGAFFLTRLSRLLAIRARGSAPKSSREAGLVDRAIYSTYRDLQSLGLAGEARALLRPVRRKGRGS